MLPPLNILVPDKSKLRIVIRRYLREKNCTQTALAEYLGMTPSAVTQLKQGIFLLSPEQLHSVAKFLEMDPEAMTEFYAQVFSGRLLVPKEQTRPHFSLHWHPASGPGTDTVCPLELLEQYEPLLEPLSGYLRNCGLNPGRYQLVRSPDGKIWQLRCDAYPRPGEIILLKCRREPLRICRLICRGTERLRLTGLDAKAPEWGLPLERILWLRPAEPCTSPVQPQCRIAEKGL